MKLIAKWKPELDPAYDEPSSVVWEDGTPATLNDYRTHELDTHCLHTSDEGEVQRHMYPDIVAEITYEPNVQDWVMRGQDVNTAALELHDPNATDVQILAEVFTFPTVYRHRIIRP
jgi:hypothetical protein